MLSRAVASIFFEEHRPQKLLIHGLYAGVARDSCLPCKRYCRAASRAAACRAPVALLVAYRVNVPLGRRTAPLRVTHGSRTGPVGYGKHWRLPCGARTMPVRASHGVAVESCELFTQTISIQPSQAASTGPVAWCYGGLMWPREQHRRKIPTGASLDLTGKKSYGWQKSYGARGWMWLGTSFL